VTSAVGRYSPREEVANSVTHAVGIVLSVVGTLALQAAVSGGVVARLAALVFGLSLIILYTTSTLYHAVSKASIKGVLRVLDHAAIYVLIAGTYTPVALVGIRGRWGLALVVTVWLLTVVGVVTAAISLRRFRVLSMVLYLTMGWLVVAAGPEVVSSLDPAEIALLAGGGICYTGGLGFYGWRRLPFGHAVWHGFVLAGSLLHFIAVMGVVGR
jgi:hemolysin III